MQKEEAVRVFREKYDADLDGLVIAPGRVNLIGEHTDYSDGFVLPVAINLAISIAFRAREDKLIRLFSMDFDESAEINLGHLTKKGGAWWEYIQGVAWALLDSGYVLQGWDGVISGNIPIGAGLSSSAALEVATARLFAQIGGYDLHPVSLAMLGRRAEIEWMGVNVGIMDQLISAAGKKGSALKLDCRTMDYEYIPIPEGVQIGVLDTNTRRELTQSSYNNRQSEVATASKILGVSALRDASSQLLKEKCHLLPLTLIRRAKHVIEENRRVNAFALAMNNGSFEAMGRLINESHHSLRDNFEVSSPELNLIVELAQNQPECLGARMTGAGFGGCALALVKNGDLSNFVDRIYQGYEEKTGLRPAIFTVEAADGVHLSVP